MNAAWTSASEEMYKATQGNGSTQQPGADGHSNGAGEAEHAAEAGAENVTDAEFEEVK